jgi:site-specific DNA recombinase
MIDKIEAGEANGILAWHPDRLARNSVDGGKVIYLVDTGKIVSLRFPQFWFEPTPQGKFMLQVAFGQSKYFSDNLVENVKRGIRQKLRRGEWLTKAPFGYVNNPKTRNIEPDIVNLKLLSALLRNM